MLMFMETTFLHSPLSTKDIENVTIHQNCNAVVLQCLTTTYFVKEQIKALALTQ